MSCYSSVLSVKDFSLIRLWEAMESRVPVQHRLQFSDSLTQNALSIEQWFLNPDFDQDRRRIEVLNLAGRQIEVIPSQIKELTALRELDLSDNQIIDVPEEISGLSQLQQLNLDRNPILFVDPSIPKSSNPVIFNNRRVLQFERELFHVGSSKLAQLYQSVIRQETNAQLIEHFKQLNPPVKQQMQQEIKVCLRKGRDGLGLSVTQVLLKQWETLPASQKICAMNIMNQIDGVFSSRDEEAMRGRAESNLPLLADVLEYVSPVDIAEFKTLSAEDQEKVLQKLTTLQQITLLKECLDPDVDIPNEYQDLALTSDLLIDPIRDQCPGSNGGHLFERISLLRYCAKQTIPGSEVDSQSVDVPAVCPHTRVPLGVSRIYERTDRDPHPEDWTYDRHYYVTDLGVLKPDAEVQLTILQWLKTQVSLAALNQSASSPSLASACG